MHKKSLLYRTDTYRLTATTIVSTEEEKKERVKIAQGRGRKEVERGDECSSFESVWLRSNSCHGFEMFPWKC